MERRGCHPSLETDVWVLFGSYKVCDPAPVGVDRAGSLTRFTSAGDLAGPGCSDAPAVCGPSRKAELMMRQKNCLHRQGQLIKIRPRWAGAERPSARLGPPATPDHRAADKRRARRRRVNAGAARRGRRRELEAHPPHRARHHRRIDFRPPPYRRDRGTRAEVSPCNAPDRGLGSTAHQGRSIKLARPASLWNDYCVWGTRFTRTSDNRCVQPSSGLW